MEQSQWGVLTAVVLAVGFGGAEVLAASGELDGRIYAGVMVEDDTEGADPCEFHFANGKFRCTVCEHLGFGLAEYFAIPDGEDLYFAAEVDGKPGAHMSWEGRVTGETFEGEVRIRRRKKPTRTRWFNATLQTREGR